MKTVFRLPEGVQPWYVAEGPEAMALEEHQTQFFTSMLNEEGDVFRDEWSSDMRYREYGYTTNIDKHNTIQANFAADEKLMLLRAWVTEWAALNNVVEELYEDDVLIFKNV